MSGSTDASEDECLAAWCADDDWCAVTCTMEVLGKKWHPVILHRLLEEGPLRFNELSNDLGGITNKVLSNSLKDLQEKNLVERTVESEQPVAVEYALTEEGQSLETVLESLEAWGEAHLGQSDGSTVPGC